jgi:hypothetical protein
MARINFAGLPNIQLNIRAASFLPLQANDKLNNFNFPQNDRKSDNPGCSTKKSFGGCYLTWITLFANYS